MSAVDAVYSSRDDEAREALARVAAGKGSRNRACKCAACGYSAYTTRKWLVSSGAPHCPVHGPMLPVLLEDVALLEGWEGDDARCRLEAAAERSARSRRAAESRAYRREDRELRSRDVQARLSRGERPACSSCGVVRPVEDLEQRLPVSSLSRRAGSVPEWARCPSCGDHAAVFWRANGAPADLEEEIPF